MRKLRLKYIANCVTPIMHVYRYPNGCRMKGGLDSMTIDHFHATRGQITSRTNEHSQATRGQITSMTNDHSDATRGQITSTTNDHFLATTW